MNENSKWTRIIFILISYIPIGICFCSKDSERRKKFENLDHFLAMNINFLIFISLYMVEFRLKDLIFEFIEMDLDYCVTVRIYERN